MDGIINTIKDLIGKVTGGDFDIMEIIEKIKSFISGLMGKGGDDAGSDENTEADA